MGTRTFTYTLDPTSGTGPCTFDHPVRQQILDHIADTGGRAAWVTDRAILHGRGSMDWAASVDRIHHLGVVQPDAATDLSHLRWVHSTPYGWGSVLTGGRGLYCPDGANVAVEVSDYSGRHLLAVTVDDKTDGRPPVVTYLAHLGPNQELTGDWQPTVEELVALVADPTVDTPRPPTTKRHRCFHTGGESVNE